MELEGWTYIDGAEEEYISEENRQLIFDYKRSLASGMRYIVERKRMEVDVHRMDKKRADEKATAKSRVRRR